MTPNTAPTAMMRAAVPDDGVALGRLQGAWGVKGWSKLLPYSADADVLLGAKTWYLQAPTGRYAKGFEAFEGCVRIAVDQCKPHSDALVVHFEGIDDRDQVHALRGAEVWVSRAEFPKVASDDEFYWVDLIGCEVVNRQGEVLGRVQEMLSTGPQAVLCITQTPTDDPKLQRLIPFVAQYIDAVSLSDQRITVDWLADYD
ncbi:ribosome maturation factor RimM [Comamonadaceae bacterium M7527]|nr:ribosome maturation factor RimM [Comamonadaceae bacterium M7527]